MLKNMSFLVRLISFVDMLKNMLTKEVKQLCLFLSWITFYTFSIINKGRSMKRRRFLDQFGRLDLNKMEKRLTGYSWKSTLISALVQLGANHESKASLHMFFTFCWEGLF